MSLKEKQFLFSRLLALLILEAERQGFRVTMGDVWRSKEQAKLYEERGIGIAKSLHAKRLAADINLFRDGEWLKNSEAFTSLGIWWESQHPLCRWGGRFSKPDGNHFSIEHEGIR